MRMALALTVVTACSLASGCRIGHAISRNLVYESYRYCDDYCECYRNRQLAKDAWEKCAGSSGKQSFSEDYVRGFIDGYDDYLTMRGTGAPPALPPKCYWSRKYQSPSGHQAIENWYAGFHHGANAARESLLGQHLTVPSHHAGPDPVRQAGAPPEAAPPPGEGLDLPLPKKLMDPVKDDAPDAPPGKAK